MNTINNMPMLLLNFFTGALLGIFFFGGLWLTVKMTAASGWASLWYALSLLLRTAVVLTGLYAVADGDWKALLTCVAGFVAARYLLLLSVAPSKNKNELVRKDDKP